MARQPSPSTSPASRSNTGARVGECGGVQPFVSATSHCGTFDRSASRFIRSLEERGEEVEDAETVTELTV